MSEEPARCYKCGKESDMVMTVSGEEQEWHICDSCFVSAFKLITIDPVSGKKTEVPDDD